MQEKIVQKSMETAMKALSRVGTSEWLEQRGLRDQAQKLAQSGARATAVTAQRVAEAVKSRAPKTKTKRTASPFDLNPTDEQQLIIDTLNRVAKEVLAPMAEEADDKAEMPEDAIEIAADLGLAEAAIPEGLGGEGERSPVTLALTAEALGAGDMGMAVAMLAPSGVVHTIVDQATDAQKAAWLPPFGGETFIPASLAIMEGGALADPNKPNTSAKKGLTKSDYILRGEKCHVPLIGRAEFFLVSAKTSDGPRLFRVARNQKGVTCTAEAPMGLRAAELGTLTLDEVVVAPEDMLGDDSYDHDRVVDLGRIAWCALATGQAQAVLDYCIEYANDREAFGAPISHRQAVAFMIADMAIELESMRLMTWRAASRADQGMEFGEATYLARLLCAEKAMKIGTDGVQVLGGHGFTKEHPIERWYRHLRGAGIMEGALSA